MRSEHWADGGRQQHQETGDDGGGAHWDLHRTSRA
jgi:hypothetical protein